MFTRTCEHVGACLHAPVNMWDHVYTHLGHDPLHRDLHRRVSHHHLLHDLLHRHLPLRPPPPQPPPASPHPPAPPPPAESRHSSAPQTRRAPRRTLRSAPLLTTMRDRDSTPQHLPAPSSQRKHSTAAGRRGEWGPAGGDGGAGGKSGAGWAGGALSQRLAGQEVGRAGGHRVGGLLVDDALRLEGHLPVVVHVLPPRRPSHDAATPHMGGRGRCPATRL
jgi:hypothetical protein